MDRRGGAVLVAGGLAAAAAGVAGAVRSGRFTRRAAAADRPPGELWTCRCGTRLRSSGAGRHRVHWRAGAAESDPLLEDACPSCGRALS